MSLYTEKGICTQSKQNITKCLYKIHDQYDHDHPPLMPYFFQHTTAYCEWLHQTCLKIPGKHTVHLSCGCPPWELSPRYKVCFYKTEFQAQRLSTQPPHLHPHLPFYSLPLTDFYYDPPNMPKRHVSHSERLSLYKLFISFECLSTVGHDEA